MAADYEDAFTLSFVGIPEIQRTIRSTLHGDQTKLTIASILLCIAVAGTIFRSWRGALICSVPPVIGVVWYFGFLAVFSIPVDFLTTIVPTMVIVIAFADGVHLYMSIQRKRADGMAKGGGYTLRHCDNRPSLFSCQSDHIPGLHWHWAWGCIHHGAAVLYRSGGHYAGLSVGHFNRAHLITFPFKAER